MRIQRVTIGVAVGGLMSLVATPRSSVVVRFAGDSGDGMQLTGEQFTQTSAIAGNDLATLPDFPAEIRAPAGTREGVSAFQIQLADHDVFTPGDACDVLVAMNPAALVTNLKNVRSGGLVIVNTDRFTERDLEKARLTTDPLTDGTMDGYRVVRAPITSGALRAVQGAGLPQKEADRCKNFYALGMAYWLYSRDPEPTRRWVHRHQRGTHAEANLAALDAGFHLAETMELFQERFRVAPAAAFPPGTYRNITGNRALALGLVAAAVRAGRDLFYGSYPITPASDILHSLAAFKHFGVLTYQAEDEIAAIGAAIGASYGGAIGVTGTSGPGLALKSEALNLAVSVELPLVVVNVQRAGPSTGMPTKTEQADLLQALYGRNGESPIVVLAPATPSDCFAIAVEAVQIATSRMVPVMILSDGYVANGAEPWRVPSVEDLPDLHPTFREDPAGFQPFSRDPRTLARPWVVPGTAGLQHRIGGIEKQDGTGNISYGPENHQRMSELRAEKVARAAEAFPSTEVYGDDDGILVVGWGSTFGALRSAVEAARAEGVRAAHVHVRHLNPLPRDLGAVLRRYGRVLVPELNLGQLVKILRAEYLVDATPVCKIQGQPFKTDEVLTAIRAAASAEVSS
jgi:2-oxoglutarate ferredoxin oxidoreductase subunit alpha